MRNRIQNGLALFKPHATIFIVELKKTSLRWKSASMKRSRENLLHVFFKKPAYMNRGWVKQNITNGLDLKKILLQYILFNTV